MTLGPIALPPPPQYLPPPSGDYHRTVVAGSDAPAFTLRAKPPAGSEGGGSPGAGPGEYNPEKMLPSAPAFTMRPKTSIGGGTVEADVPGQFG